MRIGLKKCRMTTEKVKVWREKWQESVAVYRKTAIVPTTTTPTKMLEDKAICNTMKLIIQNRLFKRQYFNKELKMLHIKGTTLDPNMEDMYTLYVNEEDCIPKQWIPFEDVYCDFTNVEEIVFGHSATLQSSCISPLEEFMKEFSLFDSAKYLKGIKALSISRFITKLKL